VQELWNEAEERRLGVVRAANRTTEEIPGGKLGRPPTNPEQEKQFLAGSRGKVDLGARTQTETEQRARPNYKEQREAGPRKPRVRSDRCCREFESGKKQDRRTAACAKNDSEEKTGLGADQATRTNTNRRTSWARHRCVLATRVENEERKTRRQTGHTRLKRKRDSSMNKKRSTEIRERAAKSDLAPPNQTSKNTQHTSCKPDFSIKI
jgi:hypothetical protein